jgi:hypothetical protein
MRRSLLLLAVSPPLFAPPAFAKDGSASESSCPPPTVTHQYDTEQLAVHVKLPASGCASREHSMFMVSASITRFDEHGPTGSVDRSVMCGPFRSAADRGADEPVHEYFCELDVALDHPEVESINYDIDVAYPGATSNRNLTLILACSSDGETAARRQ